MMLVERHLRFPTAVLCAGPAGVFCTYGLEIEGNAEAGLARVRAIDADGHPLPCTILVDLHELPHGVGVLPVGGRTSVSGCDEDGHLMLRVQATLEIERDSLGVLVWAPGPDIPWSLGVPRRRGARVPWRPGGLCGRRGRGRRGLAGRAVVRDHRRRRALLRFGQLGGTWPDVRNHPATFCQSACPGEVTLPAAARAQSGGLVSLGRGSVREGGRGAEADLSLGGLFNLSLVPRDGPRVVRGRDDRRGAQPRFRPGESRPGGAPRYRPRLHDLRAGGDRAGRMADERVADA